MTRPLGLPVSHLSRSSRKRLRLSREVVKAQLKRLKLSDHLFDNKVCHSRHFLSLSDSWSFESLHFWLENTCNFLRTVAFTRRSDLGAAERAFSAKAAFSAIVRGHSLQINGLGRVLGPSDPLMTIFFALQEHLGLPLEQILMFYTPSSKRGLPFHADETDIVTIQLLGSKHWDIWPDMDVQDCKQVAPQLGIDLRPGSILYVPAFTPHAVVAGSQDSLSVAFRLHPRRYGELFAVLSNLPALSKIINRNVPMRGEISTAREQLNNFSLA